MKKILAALCTSALLLSLTACSGDPSESPGGGSQSQSSDSSSTIPDSSYNNSTQSDHESSAPAPQKPEGEPTFLTCPDGTVIYTSQITKYQSSARSGTDGSHEQFPLDTFNKETFTDNTFPQVVCDGFAYAFMPCANISVYEEPEKFTDDGGIMMYSGEPLPPSGEYFRLKVGDKFGGLTVKSAEAVFSNSNAYWQNNDPDDIPGIYLTGAVIEYEGEIQMKGRLSIRKTEGYFQEGDLWFYPIGDCVTEIPAAWYCYNDDVGLNSIFHEADNSAGIYGELVEMNLGNMYDHKDVDFDRLKPGESALVNITIKDPIIHASDGYLDCLGEPVAVEALK